MSVAHTPHEQLSKILQRNQSKANYSEFVSWFLFDCIALQHLLEALRRIITAVQRNGQRKGNQTRSCPQIASSLGRRWIYVSFRLG